ncbi:TPA: hypothetical protein ACK1Z8_003701, partial [Klebsiella michiganensis]
KQTLDTIFPVQFVRNPPQQAIPSRRRQTTSERENSVAAVAKISPSPSVLLTYSVKRLLFRT